MAFRSCPYCGAHLDPGEACNCLERMSKEELKQEAKRLFGLLPEESRVYILKECAAKR